MKNLKRAEPVYIRLKLNKIRYGYSIVYLCNFAQA